MKKSLILIICLAMVFALCACGGKTDGTESKTDFSETSNIESAESTEDAISTESGESSEVNASAETTEDTSADDSSNEDTADDSSEDVSVPDNVPDISKPTVGETLKSSYKCLKTWYNFDMGLPHATVITSPAELTTYYLNNKSILNTDFKDLINTYEDSFFERKVLILVAGMEGSGSITHELRSAVLKGEELTLTIARVIPSMGTENEMGWHLFAEIDKACLAGKDNIVINMIDE